MLSEHRFSAQYYSIWYSEAILTNNVSVPLEIKRGLRLGLRGWILFHCLRPTSGLLWLRSHIQMISGKYDHVSCLTVCPYFLLAETSPCITFSVCIIAQILEDMLTCSSLFHRLLTLKWLFFDLIQIWQRLALKVTFINVIHILVTFVRRFTAMFDIFFNTFSHNHRRVPYIKTVIF